jgi:hypothetical protein
MSASKPKEFGLSDEVPLAFREMDLKRAESAWKARSDAAAEAVAFPSAPYRIRGDSDAGCWFVEEAQIIRSSMPYDERYQIAWMHSMLMRSAGVTEGVKFDRSPYIATLNADEPTATLEWKKIGKARRGFFTYTKAARWLRQYLEPIRDESTYFTDTGSEA